MRAILYCLLLLLALGGLGAPAAAAAATPPSAPVQAVPTTGTHSVSPTPTAVPSAGLPTPDSLARDTAAWLRTLHTYPPELVLAAAALGLALVLWVLSKLLKGLVNVVLLLIYLALLGVLSLWLWG